MNLHLSINPKKPMLTYGLPIWFRLFMAAIAGIFILAVFYAGQPSILGIIVCAISLLSALYQEKWIFDIENDQCIAKLGLVFFAKGPNLKISNIQAIRVDIFRKGSIVQNEPDNTKALPYGSQARLIIDTNDGQSFMLDSVPAKRKSNLEQTAKTIAEQTNISFVG